MKKLYQIFLSAMVIVLLSAVSVHARGIKVSGTVRDSYNICMPGVAVVVAGTSTGTTTDHNGHYSIEAPADASLVFSCMGYMEREVAIMRRSIVNVTLKEDVRLLDEVVVVGMGTQKRSTITAAVASVGSDALTDRPVTDLTNALQGNIAGLNFITDANDYGVGGEPGSEIRFNIRGLGSINGGSPYILVDGVEQSMQNVNPADVESVTVLKDASASAVYGARAAYGVVLVTTKKGNVGKSKVRYSGTAGFSSPINMPEMMSSLEFAGHMNQMRENSGQSALFTPKAFDMIKGFAAAPYSSEYPGIMVNKSGDGWASAYYNQYADTDWFDYYFKDAALRHSHNLSVSGGTEKFRYYLGAGYIHQDGLIDHTDDKLNKYNVNIKLSFQAKPWLGFSVSNNLTVTDIVRPLANQTIFYAQISDKYPTQTTRLPVAGEYDIPSWNEVMYLKQTEFRQCSLSDAMSLSATITPVQGWDIVADMKARFDVLNSSFVMGFPKTTLPDGKIVTTSGSKQGYQYPGMHWKNTSFGSYTRGNAFDYYLSPSVSTSYTATWDRHYFKAMAGFQAEMQKKSSGFTYKDGMLSEDVFSFANANGKVTADERRDHWSTMGVFARVNWNWREIFFAEASGRVDGSSRFAPGHRWGVFPSLSVGYDIAAADYFKALETPFNQLKVRLSYGRLGNQNGAGLYEYIGVMDLSPSDPNAWLLPGSSSAPEKGTVAKTPSMISPEITWEKVDNANVGLDLSIFRNRLNVTFDAYQRTTRDMMGPAEAIPLIGGIPAADRAKVNNSTLRNRGWELSVRWSDRLDNGFFYSAGFNLFDYKAVVTRYNNPEGLIFNNHTGLSVNRGYYEGMDVGEIWGYEADDLFMSDKEIDKYLEQVDLSFFKPDNRWRAGDLRFEDTNGDGAVNPGKGTLDDHGDLKVIGNATPRFSYGMNLSVGFRGIEVTALFQGVGKRDFPMAGSTYLFGGRNYFKDHLDRFSDENPSGWLPRLTDGTGAGDIDWKVNTGFNTTRYLLNAAYMRLKNLTLSYSFQDRILERLNMSGLRVYLSCDNVFTIDALPEAFDPETINIVNTWAGGSHDTAPGLTSIMKQNGNAKVYPLSRAFVIGVDLTF